MQEFISFDEPSTRSIPGQLAFFLTKKPAEKFYEHYDYLSRQKNFIIRPMPGHDDVQRFRLYTSKYTFSCFVKNAREKEIGIDRIEDISFNDQVNCLREGCPIVPEDMGIFVRSKKIGVFRFFHNGESFDAHTRFGKRETVEAILSLLDELREYETEQAAAEESEEDEVQGTKKPSKGPEKKFMALLDTAKSYAELEDNIAEQHMLDAGRLVYDAVEPLDYDRIDRLAYSFHIVEPFDVQLFKPKTQVELEQDGIIDDDESERQTAEVIAAKSATEEEPGHIDLLFNRQLDFADISTTGAIRLSYSSVIHDVQVEAIDRLRLSAGDTVEDSELKPAPARYLNAVIGRGETRGFDDKDLSQVMARLREQKYPPNESQLEAIRRGINTRDIMLVMGPPGTGKTTIILEWVKYFIHEEHKRVLISSQNNKAVDNVLARIAEEKGIEMIRIGSEAKLQAEIRPYLFDRKIEAESRSIAEHTNANIARTQQIAAQWRPLRDQCQPALERVERYNALKRELIKSGLAQLTQLSPLLVDAVNNLDIAREKLESAANGVKSLHDEIENLPHSGIMGIWGAIKGYFKNRSMRNKVRQLNQMVEQERMAVKQYNRLRAEYETEEERVFRLWYIPVWRVGQQCLAYNGEMQEQLTAIRQQDEGSNWHFFENIGLEVPKTVEKFGEWTNSFLREYERFEGFCQHLREWQIGVAERKNHALTSLMLESVNLVGATCIGINSQKRFSGLKFDVTIIDEAGQIQVHNALVPMSVSDKLIMLGDHKQIPPSADEELLKLCEANDVDTELLEKSLFEKLYNQLPESNRLMLDTQYRMPPEIAEIVSQEFYGGGYHSAPGALDTFRPSLLPGLSKSHVVIIDTSGDLHRYETKSEGSGTYNDLEARCIATLLRYMIRHDAFDAGEVGVISAYKLQVKRIQGLLKHDIPPERLPDIVATLDSFQGQERDIIIYSFTRSSRRPPQRVRIGFLNELRRLNVALTRCKRMLILVGDMEFLTSCRHQATDEEGQPDPAQYERSERHFSDFMKNLITAVRDGQGKYPPGEILTLAEFNERMADR